MNFTNIAFYLGDCYQHGIGTDKDESQSFKYYKLAADQNHAACAQNNLGYSYKHGKGTEKDESQAFKYYKLAA